MQYPNFLVVGAGKSGTTTVYHALKQHPDIFMSPVKEPNFFALEGQTKITGYDQEDPHGFHFYPWAVTNLDDYKQLFAEVTSEKAVGESSTMYQYMPQAPENIKKHLPNVKIIAIFRQPADRLYSRYLHLVRENRPPTEEFTACFDRNSLWWQKNDLIQEGFYYSHMKRYFDTFDPAMIRVVLYEDLKNNGPALIQELYEFLGVDPSFEPNLSVRYNLSGRIKNRLVDRFIGQQSIIRKAIEQVAPPLIQKARDSQVLQKVVTSLRAANLERVPLDRSTKQRLTEEVYKDEIVQFSSLINRDLSHWLTFD